MIKFKKYDEIEHPVHGRGVVKKVNKIDDTLSPLVIQFDKTGEQKQLNSTWVEERCICHCAESNEAVAEKYVEIPFPEHPEWKVELNRFVPLTEELKENIHFILSNVTPGIVLVLIGNLSVVALFPEEGKDYKSKEKYARRYMNSVFSKHPGFEADPLDSGGAVIFMNNGRLWQVILPEAANIQSDHVPLGTALMARGELLERCEKREILGIITG